MDGGRRSGSAETRLDQGRQSAVVSAPPSWASTATSASARPAAMTPYSIARLSASFLENNWTNRFIRTSSRNYPTRAYRSYRQIWWRRPLAACKSLRNYARELMKSCGRRLGAGGLWRLRGGWLGESSPQIVFVGRFDGHARAIAGAQAHLAVEIDIAVDLRRVPGRTGDGAVTIDLIDDDFDGLADA